MDMDNCFMAFTRCALVAIYPLRTQLQKHGRSYCFDGKQKARLVWCAGPGHAFLRKRLRNPAHHTTRAFYAGAGVQSAFDCAIILCFFIGNVKTQITTRPLWSAATKSDFDAPYIVKASSGLTGSRTTRARLVPNARATSTA